MSSISRFFNSSGSEKKSLSDVFDFDNFADHVKLTTHIASGNGLDSVKVNDLITSLVKGYNNQSKLKQYVDTDFIITFIDQYIIYEVASAITVQNQKFSYTNASHSKDLRTLIYSIFNIIKNGSNVVDTNVLFKSNVLSFADIGTIQQQLHQLSTDTFKSFHKKYRNTGETEEVFRQKLENIFMDKLYIVFYFAHIYDRSMFCNDFKCKRSFVLAKYVFVYHVFMTIFLIIFSSADSVQVFKTATKKDNNDLQSLKTRMVSIMDSILTLLQEENILDTPGLDNTSTIGKYYDKIKDLSDKNVLKSNFLNEKKKTALMMQNNLGNFSNYEALAHRELYYTKVGFFSTIVVMLIVLLILLVLVYGQQYLMLIVVSGVVMLGLAIYGLLSAIKQ